jgi:NAD-dependent dihydropyrimidine dehydrogenase PreA subunit
VGIIQQRRIKQATIMPHKTSVILSKDRSGRPDRRRMEEKLLAGLEGLEDVPVTVVPHLYDLTPDGPGMQRLRSTGGDLVVLAWLYPRAAYWVLDANRIKGRLGPTSSLPQEDPGEPAPPDPDAPDRTIWCFDLRTHDLPERYLEEIRQLVAAAAGVVDEAGRSAGGGRADVLDEATTPRWYPVVDYGRCTDCLECLNFCLFGVYELDESGRVVAEQPDACRPGCPACSRICPAGAIMFPEHEDPAIAGDPKASLEGLKLDLSQLFASLTAADLAAVERDRALAERAGEQAPPGRQEPAKPVDKDDLDHLVDELDDLDL